MRIRILAPAILAIALASVPARAATRTSPEDGVSALAASRAGLYMLTLVGDRGAQAVDLAIEQTKDGFTALLITPTHESWLSDVKFDGTRLTGTAVTSAGRSTLVLKLSNTDVHGTLVVAGRTVMITGVRER